MKVNWPRRSGVAREPRENYQTTDPYPRGELASDFE